MITPNMHYADLKDSYLFYNIAQKTKAALTPEILRLSDELMKS